MAPGLLDQMPGAYTPLPSSGVSATLQSAAMPIWKLERQRACWLALQSVPVVLIRSSCR